MVLAVVELLEIRLSSRLRFWGTGWAIFQAFWAVGYVNMPPTNSMRARIPPKIGPTERLLLPL
jgi:hypothetical protein